MADGSLTQEEIDLLLQGADDLSGQASESGPAQQQGGGEDLSPLEKENLADIVYQGLRSGTQSLSMILARSVNLGNPYAEVRTPDDAEREFSEGYVYFSQNLTGALSGSVALFLSTSDAGKISSLLMGGDGADEPTASLDSAQIATIKDAMGPLLFSMVNQFSVKAGEAVTPLGLDVKNVAEEPTFPVSGGRLLRVQIPLKIENTVDSRVTLLMPLDMARSLHERSRSRGGPGGAMMGQESHAPQGPQPGQNPLKNVGFPQLSNAGMGPLTPNMDLLMDVEMTLTVELGRTKKYIKEILSLGEGSIIELDKLAGEPVDLLVNGKLIAKGEVVVIDENFGVRVTDIVSQAERLKARKQS